MATAAVQPLLDEIGRIFDNPPVDVSALQATLTSLVKSFAISPADTINPPQLREVPLGIVPALPLPRVAASTGSVLITHTVTWSFFEGQKRMTDSDVFAENFASPSVSALLKPKVVEAPPSQQTLA